MYDTPATLEELCLDTICAHVFLIFELYDETVEELCLNRSSEHCLKSYDVVHKKFRFKDPDIFLFNELSEKLLEKFGQNNLQCDALLNLFTAKNTRLRNVKIKNTKKVTAEGLKMLKQHKIVDLECVNLRSIFIGKILGKQSSISCIFVRRNSILDSLGTWSQTNIRNLNLTKCSFIDTCGYSLMVNLTHLKNLRSLNVSYTELNQQSLQMICEDLKYLEKLDISGTVVQDLSPLLLLSDQLVSVTISVSTLY